MKKSTLILSGLLLAGAGFSAQAQSTEDAVFIVGNFNDWTAEGDAIWALNLVSDVAEEGADIYRGTFGLAEGEVSFYLDYNGVSLVPGTLVDGEIEQASSNAVVLSDDDFYEGCFATSGFSGENGLHWVISNWPGGNLEVTVDFTNQTIAISSAEYSEEENYVAYIAGNFNDWDPQDLEIWALNLVPGTEDTFRGTFNLGEGEVSFYINYSGILLVPGMVDEDGEIVADPNGATFGNHYEGLFATTGFASEGKWFNLSWPGGDLEVTVNFTENTIVIGVPQEEPITANVFLAGNFNDYNPNGLELWQLGATNKEGVYELDFEFAEEWVGQELKFYFLVETIAVVPGVEEDGEYVWEAADVAVLDGANEFVGNWATMGAILPNYYWTTEYEGGVLGFSVDLNNNVVKFNKGGYSGINTIKTNIENGAIYNLQGVRVSKDNLAKGIYVINGKKVLVK